MKPGRELDALVAEKVMGLYNVVTGLYQSDRDYRGQWEKDLLHSPFPITIGHQEPVPHYSTDIAAAWEVVEKLRALGYQFTLGSFLSQYGATFYTPKQRTEWDSIPTMRGATPLKSVEDTAPHAICMAALRAVGAL